ncbi:MAG: bifunctional 4-hydroxy-2-oxoglutarate aldolase/2-dehydro-3-deoxy-phosphogluconate aldolase [Planctomycetota bacterium]
MPGHLSSPLEKLSKARLTPVIDFPSIDLVDPIIDALLAGGLPIAEVTFRTPIAAQALKRIALRNDILLLAGTVRTEEQVDAAVDSGAEIIVMPGFNPRVVERALRRGIDVCPGVCTPTDIEAATAYGLHTLKFFPAEACGGVAALRALSGPYPDVGFIATGGITRSNLTDYLSVPSVVACGGSWLTHRDLYAHGDFSQIAAATQDAVTAIQCIHKARS